MTVAIVVLNQRSVSLARQVAQGCDGMVYGLDRRTTGVDHSFAEFGPTLRSLFEEKTPIIGICAAGILIRTLAPVLGNKTEDPPVLAIAEDGSTVVPLLGGLQGVNDLARQIAQLLQVSPAITASGEIRFRTTLLAPPRGYRLLNDPDQAKGFIAQVLAGATVRFETHPTPSPTSFAWEGSLPEWLEQSRLPWSESGSESGEYRLIVATEIGPDVRPSDRCLVYEQLPQRGYLAIVGTGPGSFEWMSPQVRRTLLKATDWVGYRTYLNLVEPLRSPSIRRHESDNRVEGDRARQALDLAAMGRRVVLVSSGDPGIFAMAAAVFEVLETRENPDWSLVEIEVCPGISAMQAAAAQVGAPLGHDFAVISLSDILKPWSVVESRLRAAAQGDFAIALYNPVSKQRTWQLDRARELLLEWRSPATPVVLARNLGRVGQGVRVKPLAEVTAGDADMRTVILIGSSQTRQVQSGEGRPWVYTPRTYGG
ncbi:MAG: precorrin-3B C(17)-methyltransferase [Sodalinema sp.]|uniref:precorrin-3B C(17)-methyltransferase n=1 Tax=Sodalinema sp. TaxID=3080550 RepID=UPI00396F6D9A